MELCHGFGVTLESVQFQRLIPVIAESYLLPMGIECCTSIPASFMLPRVLRSSRLPRLE